MPTPKAKAAPTIRLRGRPPADPNSPARMPLQAFAATLVGTPNEVWTSLLRQSHGREAHSYREWLALIDQHGASKG